MGYQSKWLVALAGVALLVAGVSNVWQSRGLRNNNPGNIRRGSSKWQGMVSPGSDPEFVQFESPEWGIRAMGILIHNYRERYGLRTIRQVIDRWAPPVENDTGAYVAAVVQSMRGVNRGSLSISADDPLTDADTVPLIAAIIHHENGRQPFAADFIRYSVGLA